MNFQIFNSSISSNIIIKEGIFLADLKLMLFSDIEYPRKNLAVY
jgi:hypothetical protein